MLFKLGSTLGFIIKNWLRLDFSFTVNFVFYKLNHGDLIYCFRSCEWKTNNDKSSYRIEEMGENLHMHELEPEISERVAPPQLSLFQWRHSLTKRHHDYQWYVISNDSHFGRQRMLTEYSDAISHHWLNFGVNIFLTHQLRSSRLY